MFTVTGHRAGDQNLSLPCGSYHEAMAAYQRPQSEGWRDLRITRQAHDQQGTDQAFTELIQAALTEMFPAEAAEAIHTAEAFGALAYRPHQRAQLYGQTPSQVLRELSHDDLYFTWHAQEPAAFLAAKVRDLP